MTGFLALWTRHPRPQRIQPLGLLQPQGSSLHGARRPAGRLQKGAAAAAGSDGLTWGLWHASCSWAGGRGPRWWTTRSFSLARPSLRVAPELGSFGFGFFPAPPSGLALRILKAVGGRECRSAGAEESRWGGEWGLGTGRGRPSWGQAQGSCSSGLVSEPAARVPARGGRARRVTGGCARTAGPSLTWAVQS